MYPLATILFVTETDGQTDDSLMPVADHIACSSTIG